MRDQDRAYLESNVLTTSEVADMLQCSTKTVNHYIINENLGFLKKTTSGYLFLRNEVEKFKIAKYHKNRNMKGNIYFSNSGTTRRCLSYFDEHRHLLNEISSVCVFFNDIDAIVNGFFDSQSNDRHPTLKSIQCPSMTITDIDGNGIWLGGCNAGYSGEGPRGSIDVLKKLGIFTDEMETAIKSNDVVIINRSMEVNSSGKSEYEVYCKESIIKRSDMFGEKRRNINADLYLLGMDIVLVQSHQFGWDSDPLEVINKYIEFIPSPKEIIVFNTEEQAIERGYFIKGSAVYDDETYQIIIKDSSGRQLWLSPYFNADRLSKPNENVVMIADVLGFELKEDTMTDTMKRWLNILLDRKPAEPLIIRK